MSCDNFLYCLDCDEYHHYGQRDAIYNSLEELNGFSEFLSAHENHCMSPQRNDCGDLYDFADDYHFPGLSKEEKKRRQIELLEGK